MSTHQAFPERQQDPILFRNLVKQLDRSLADRPADGSANDVIASFRQLGEDEAFWTRAPIGLAVFGAPQFFRIVPLRRPVPDVAIVADSFHVKPLLRQARAADRYQVLGLSLDGVRLFEAVGSEAEEVDLDPAVPRTMADALGGDLTEPHLTVAAYGKGASGPAMRHGHGSRKDERDVDVDRFLRAIDRAILEHHSAPADVPLLLASLAEHQTRFRRLSHSPRLADASLVCDPARMQPQEIGRRAWEVMQPALHARVADVIDRFRTARASARGSDRLEDVAEAAIRGRVDTLIVDADRQRPGRIDRSTGRVTDGDLSDAGVDDALDDLAEIVLDHQGDVLVVSSDRMPGSSGCAAIYRF